MPTSATNSSSSLGYVALGDHLVKSLHHKPFVVEGYLQDMVMHDLVAVGRDIIWSSSERYVVYVNPQINSF
jgi:hypothetical protein